jgi:hypothetical protein
VCKNGRYCMLGSKTYLCMSAAGCKKLTVIAYRYCMVNIEGNQSIQLSFLFFVTMEQKSWGG